MIKDYDGQLNLSRSLDKMHDNHKDEAHNYPSEFLNSLRLGSYPPHVLELKYGAPFILLQNLDLQNGHVNGARYVIIGTTKRIIHGRLAVGPKKGN